MTPRFREVLVVTVSYHSNDVLPGFLQSLITAATGSRNVVIVNNAVDDAPLAVAPVMGLDITVREAGVNLGYGKAMNMGSTMASEEWLLLANPDVTFSPGSLDELMRVGASAADIGAVGPLIYTPSGEIYPSARKLPSLRTGIGHALFSRVWKTNPWTMSYLADRELPARQRDAGWISGACMLIRRDVFESIGGFDDKYFMYFEDVDICARITKAGLRVVYAPSAAITHSGAHSTSSSSEYMVQVHHKSAYIYLAARYGRWYLWPVRALLRIGLAVRAQIVKD